MSSSTDKKDKEKPPSRPSSPEPDTMSTSYKPPSFGSLDASQKLNSPEEFPGGRLMLLAEGNRVAGNGIANVAPIFKASRPQPTPAPAAGPATPDVDEGADASRESSPASELDDAATEDDSAAGNGVEDGDPLADEEELNSAAFQKYYLKVSLKIKRRMLGGRSPYRNDELFYRRPSNVFLLNRTPFPKPSELTLPDVLLVFPHALQSKLEPLQCIIPTCSGRMGLKGFTNTESRCRMIRGFDFYAVLTQRYRCNKPQCRVSCMGTDLRLLGQLPPHVRNRLQPYLTSHRSGLDQRTADALHQGFANRTGPTAFARLLRAQAAIDYDRARLDYGEAARYRAARGTLGLSLADLEDFPPFEDKKAS
ncbi:hypothetical protein BCR35DRAFT_327562 [Leucosporidium creatinivorum]|uniref:Uncharacterized protein n=1 Tax=Leucosporidium creatinivorum TaxID=106004 RepID=A0A1Y2G3D0_9BASI|nr:hypothetical protein BCR35DRAFT_327562 [Leucosporidium creatinivorum]